MKPNRFGCLLGIVLAIVAYTSVNAQSYTNYRTSDGFDFAVRVSAEKETIMFGETTYLLFEIKNLSDKVLSFGDGGDYRNRLGRPESYSVSVIDSEGRSVEQPDAGISMGGLFGSETVPVGGSYVRRLFLSHWATFETTGNYTITVSRGLSIRHRERGSSAQPADVVKASVTTRIKIVETDNAKMGDVIDELGNKLLNGKVEIVSRDALMLLDFIKDSRTIPYWLTAVDRYSKSSEYQTLSTLRQTPLAVAKYDTPEVLTALEAAMKSKNEDVRLDVADAFGLFTNSKALKLLLSMENDPYYFVRLRVVQALGKINTDESTEKLIKKLTDSEKWVRQQAEDALRNRDKLPDPMPLLPIADQDCSIRQTSVFKSMQDGRSGSGSKSGNTGSFVIHNCAKALEAFRFELTESRTEKNTLTEAWILYQIGDIYTETKRHSEAREYYEMALPLFRLLSEDSLGDLLNDLAYASQQLKDYPQALEYRQQELLVARLSNDKYARSDEGRILERIADVHFASGDTNKGIESLEKWLSFELKNDNETRQMQAFTALGRSLEKVGRKADALSNYKQALSLAVKRNSKLTKIKWIDDHSAKELKNLEESISRLSKLN